ncbi:MAG: polysaccharide biosynthesis/export family protein [Phycisphaeraceae bacterium]
MQDTASPRHFMISCALAPVLFFSSSCTTYTDYSAFIREPRPLVTAAQYRMEPPDVIAINSKRVREVNGHREMIRPDGKITLPLLGTIFVAGQTPEQVSAHLQELARDYYEDAEVSLRVIEFRSKKIYVFGEVAVAGPYPYNGANTVLATMARAQPTRLADPQKIHILRPNADGELIRRMTVDLNRMVKEGDTTLDAVLEEGDIIYVPANGLAVVGLAIQQLLLPLTPAARTVQNPGEIDADLRARPYSTGN